MKKEQKINGKNLGLIAGCLTVALSINAAENPFEINPLGSGGELRSELVNQTINPDQNFTIRNLEAKCGESKSKEAKCGEKGKTKEAKCGESKCGEEGKTKEAKCGESKCGEEGKSKEAKCGEKGKSTEAKCGE